MKKKNVFKWVIVALVVVLGLWFILPLLTTLGGLIGSLAQGVTKVTGGIKDVVADGVNQVSKVIDKEKAAEQKSDAGSADIDTGADMSNANNPWSPLYFQRSSVPSEFQNLSDADSQDLVDDIRANFSAGKFFGAGVTPLNAVAQLKDFIGSRVELSAFCFYWSNHVGGSLQKYLTSGFSHLTPVQWATEVMPWVGGLPEL